MSASPKSAIAHRPERGASDSQYTQQAAARFRAALQDGNYYALVGPGLHRALRGAAADPSLDPEIGALRLALTRLLHEETDPARLAAGIARLTSVAVQAARLRSGPDDPSQEFRHAMLQALDDLEREKAAMG